MRLRLTDRVNDRTMLESSDILPRHLPTLQYLRAVAALGVVYFHACVQVLRVDGFQIFPKFGASGVDIFFVLSGFVMWLTTVNKGTNAFDFLRRRAVRIVPLYWPVTLFAAACALLAPHILRSTEFDARHVLASLSFIPWWNPAAPPTSSELFFPIVVPGWTLNMEMMFYVLFALCLFFPVKMRVALLAVFITCIYVVGEAVDPFDNPLSFYGDLKVFHFLAGVILAAYAVPYLTFSSAKAVTILVLSLLSICFIEYSLSARSALLAVPAILIVASCVNLERVANVPKWTWLEKLGDASYSIYLTHVFAIAGLRIAMKLSGVELNAWSAAAFVPISIVISALLGVVVHRSIEKPLIRKANLLLAGKKPAPDRAVLR